MAQEGVKHGIQLGDISLDDSKIDAVGSVQIGHIFKLHMGAKVEDILSAMQLFQEQLSTQMMSNAVELRTLLLRDLQAFLRTQHALQLPGNIRAKAQDLVNTSPDDAQALQAKALRLKMFTSFPQPLPDAIERTVYLEKIATGFEAQIKKKQSPIQIIQGTGGFGKTQLAALYANKHAGERSFVYWVYADSIQLNVQWQHLGELLGLDLKGLDDATKYQKIREALDQNESWLIVFDNLEDQVSIKSLLPDKQLPTQQVLITTRSENWGRHIPIPLPTFTLEESVTYMRLRLREDQYDGVADLVTEMGYMPLALSHAVAYMQNTGRSAAEYLKLYQSKGVVLLREAKDELESGNTRPDHAVFTTYQLAIDN